MKKLQRKLLLVLDLVGLNHVLCTINFWIECVIRGMTEHNPSERTMPGYILYFVKRTLFFSMQFYGHGWKKTGVLFV